MGCIPCQKTINKVANIVKGNYNLIARTPETEELANNRLPICEACPFKAKLIKVNQKQRYLCSICSCPIDSKIRAIEEKCPKNKW